MVPGMLMSVNTARMSSCNSRSCIASSALLAAYMMNPHLPTKSTASIRSRNSASTTNTPAVIMERTPDLGSCSLSRCRRGIFSALTKGGRHSGWLPLVYIPFRLHAALRNRQNFPSSAKFRGVGGLRDAPVISTTPAPQARCRPNGRYFRGLQNRCGRQHPGSDLPHDRDGILRGSARDSGSLGRLCCSRRDCFWAAARRRTRRQDDDLRRNSGQRPGGHHRSRGGGQRLLRPPYARMYGLGVISRCRSFCRTGNSSARSAPSIRDPRDRTGRRSHVWLHVHFLNGRSIGAGGGPHFLDSQGSLLDSRIYSGGRQCRAGLAREYLG